MIIETEGTIEGAGVAEDKTDSDSGSVPIRAKDVTKGSYVNLKDHPCVVLEVAKSKTHKHGLPKINLYGRDIFTGVKVDDSLPASQGVPGFVARYAERSVLRVVDDVAELADEGDGTTTANFWDMSNPKLRDSVVANLEEGSPVTVTVVSAWGYDGIVGIQTPR